MTESLEKIADQANTTEHTTLHDLYTSLRIMWADRKEKGVQILVGGFAVSVILIYGGLMGAIAYGKHTYDKYTSQLNQGIVSMELIRDIQATHCPDGRIKQKFTIGDKTYCIFTTSDEKKPYVSEPYSDKCECRQEGK